MSEKGQKHWRCTVPLEVSPFAQRKLRIIFRHAQNVYNACIREGRRRLKATRDHPSYARATVLAADLRQKTSKLKRRKAELKAAGQSAPGAAGLRKDIEILKAEEKALKEDRKRLYKEARDATGFSERELEKWVAQTFPKSQERLQLPAQVRNRVSRQAWKALEKVAYDRRARIPHFKGRRFPLQSITSNNLQAVSWDGETVVISGVRLPCRYTESDRYHQWLRANFGTKQITVCDVVRRASRHDWHFEAQFTCRGEPPRGKPLGAGRVGVDLGPSTIAVVSKAGAALEELCGDLTVLHSKLRRLQRQDDRQRRANNPDNFHADGRVKKGRRKWVVSNRQRQTQKQVRDLHRREAAHRKSLHGRLINAIRAAGDEVALEKLTYKS